MKDSAKKENYKKLQSDRFQKCVLQSFGICSFSKVNNDILMWSHYSDGHKGLCLVYKREPGNVLEGAEQVRYPKNNEFPYIDYWLGPTKQQIDEIAKIILTKAFHWKYEKEWRILDRPSIQDSNYKGHSVAYPESMLDGVIFGYRMDGKERQTINNILSGQSVQYYEANPIKNKFELLVTKL